MTVLESIIRGVQTLSLREQVEIARHVHSLSANALQDRAAILERTFGALDVADGESFERAMQGARRVETDG